MTTASPDFWKNKLLAYLHDPPEKAYHYGPKHKELAQRYLERILGPGKWTEHQPDWAAAAADRFIFPDGKKLNALGLSGLGGGVQFIHPLIGNLAFSAKDFPKEDDANDIISEVLPSFGESNEEVRKDAAIQFWLLWRAWFQFSVTHQRGQRHGADKLAYLPADTRVPDSTIWHHNAIVSALEAARDAKGVFAPAFLLFQIGPVQEFIAQARSTRDLWSGSYLLSWMMAHAMKLLTERFGPDCIIYPSLRGQPLYDWLNRPILDAARYSDQSESFWTALGLEKSQDLVLTPTLPNRFLAVVPRDFKPEELEQVFEYGPDKLEDGRSEWRRICDACWNWLNERAQLCPSGQINVKRQLWEFQCRNFWQITWQLWPWPDVKKALELFRQIPLGKNCSLHLGYEVAWAIPGEHKDDRCYRNGELNPGWAWSANYQLLSHRLDARRQTRDFRAWEGEPGAPKDALSGKEEAIADKDWLAVARGKNGELKYLFRKDDPLGAVNLIKRVWHKAYLENLSLHRARESFDSVPAVAAAGWLAQLREKLKTDEGCWQAFVALTDKLNQTAQHLEDVRIPPALSGQSQLGETGWLERADAAIYHASFWENLDASARTDAKVGDAAKALADFKNRFKLGEPSSYYAVLALDGDEMGKWLSGEKTPAIEQVITDKAAAYFRQHVQGVDIKQWQKSPRPLSPSYHLQFSEALANFGLYCARRIVEAHHGQLIYSGGDDVLAMLPAAEAIACAQGLQLAFQGRSEELVKHANGRYAHLFDPEVPEGFIRLKDGDWHRGCRRPAEPSWPLLVPGPKATVSVGVAIGHMREPLQDMVHEAQDAEKRAKDKFGRNAVAVTLFKRSGETVQWGCNFASNQSGRPSTSAALDLLNFIQSNHRYRRPLDQPDFKPPISAKFPYRLAELLHRYQDYELRDGMPDYSKPKPLDANLREIAQREFDWVIKQQAENLPDAEKDELCRLAQQYLDELRSQERPLLQFINLFLLEAFIARTGE